MTSGRSALSSTTTYTSFEANRKFETPRWLGLDEIHILKRARCVLTNVETNTLIDMLPDRSKVGRLHTEPTPSGQTPEELRQDVSLVELTPTVRLVVKELE